jgi:flagella basal body P-ring formation protein FlgA
LGPARTTGGGRSLATDAAVRRGQTILLTYTVPGMTLSTRARALEDGDVGQTVRLVNPSSNRPVDAIVTAPGAANAALQ